MKKKLQITALCVAFLGLGGLLRDWQHRCEKQLPCYKVPTRMSRAIIKHQGDTSRITLTDGSSLMFESTPGTVSIYSVDVKGYDSLINSYPRFERPDGTIQLLNQKEAK